jgi:hypothetical protein
MASGGLAAASEVAVVFLIRPVLAIAFVFTLILLGTPPLPLPLSLGYLVACAGSLIHFVRFLHFCVLRVYPLDAYLKFLHFLSYWC